MNTSLSLSSLIHFSISTKQSLPTLTLVLMGVDATSLTEWDWGPNPPAVDLGLVLYPSNPPVRNVREYASITKGYNALQYNRKVRLLGVSESMQRLGCGVDGAEDPQTKQPHSVKSNRWRQKHIDNTGTSVATR